MSGIDFIQRIGQEIQNIAQVRKAQFMSLQEPLQIAVITRTMLIATAALAITAALFGTFLGGVAFIATAVYVTTSVLQGLQATGKTTEAIARWTALNAINDGAGIAGDVITVGKRLGEDAFDSFTSIFKSKTENQAQEATKMGERAVVDASTFAKRIFNAIKITVNFAMSL